MLTSEFSYMRDAIDFSINHGASRFANDWLAKSSVFIPGHLPPTMIFVLTDVAISKLIAASNRTWPEIVRLREGIDILDNHISVKPTQKKWPMFESINRRAFGSDQNDIIALGPVASTIFKLHDDKILVLIVIDNIILHGDQPAKLKSSKVGYSTWQRQLDTVDKSTQIENPMGLDPINVGRDVFGLIINQGLTGRSLLALCTGNTRARELCDRDQQALFKQLLINEFNFNWDHSFARETPRELYAKFHSLRIEIYIEQSGIAEIDGNWALIENGEIDPGLASRIKDQLEIEYSRVSIPPEGWFATSVKIPTTQYVLGPGSNYSSKRAFLLRKGPSGNCNFS